jgi:hypothetical protein
MAKLIIPSGWQGITRLDQRVICVAEFTMGCASVTVVPAMGKIYRVAGFAECAGGGPGIFVREIAVGFCFCWRMKPPFDITGFRPVDEVEKKTDISVFEGILKTTKIDTRVPEDA